MLTMVLEVLIMNNNAGELTVRELDSLKGLPLHLKNHPGRGVYLMGSD